MTVPRHTSTCSTLAGLTTVNNAISSHVSTEYVRSHSFLAALSRQRCGNKGKCEIGDHPGRREAGSRGANLCRGMGMVASGGVLGPTAGPDPLPCCASTFFLDLRRLLVTTKNTTNVKIPSNSRPAHPCVQAFVSTVVHSSDCAFAAQARRVWGHASWIRCKWSHSYHSYQCVLLKQSHVPDDTLALALNL
jgi:hypothetical protein